MQVTLAEKYKEQDTYGYLMSEKLNGFRALWTGYELISRYGNKFNAPDWFIDQLPQGIALDGELNVGRGDLNENILAKVQSIVTKKRPIDSEWNKITFSVFDAPEALGCFKERLDYCSTVLKDSNKVCEVVEHQVCYGVVHLFVFFISLIANNAEGVILRNPHIEYEQFRSSNFLKLKPRHNGPSTISILGDFLMRGLTSWSNYKNNKIEKELTI